ncbi:hypothetical protein AB7Z98_04845 [Providencia manganoxydans]|uniref:hypothetical protein n=1 Tax=Providencia manganoxydans TaxID=2923283 RepID=UPI0034E51C83
MNILNRMNFTQEETFLYQKVCLNHAINLSIIEFLISESNDPDEAKKKLAGLINKNVDSRSRGAIDNDLVKLLK